MFKIATVFKNLLYMAGITIDFILGEKCFTGLANGNYMKNTLSRLVGPNYTAFFVDQSHGVAHGVDHAFEHL